VLAVVGDGAVVLAGAATLVDDGEGDVGDAGT
jgi:hypothetical protein